MSNHEHNQACAHTLKYCAQCDRAYCTACNKEWSYQQPFIPYTGGPNALTPFTQGSQINTEVGTALPTNATHSHA